MLFKNVASQGTYYFAKDTVTLVGKTGDVANHTLNISKDGGATAELASSVATTLAEIGGGMYWAPFSQAETNADTITVIGSSSTANIVILPIIFRTTAGAIPKSAFGLTGGLPSWDQVDGVDDDLATSAALAAAQDSLDEIQGAAFVEGTHALDQQSSLDDMADAVLDEDVTEHVTADTSGAAQKNNYHAMVLFLGGADPNKYRCIRWFNGDIPLESGVTNPLLRVINADTGADLIAETALSEAGSSHLYTYDATGAELAVADQAYAIRMRATIDGAVRVWEQPIVGV